jgi:DNA-binding response OmpR family regulator
LRIGHKILVVDDEVDIIISLKIALEAAGHEVVSTTDGSATKQLALKEKPAAVVLDLMMPVLDGFQVLQQLKDDPATAAIPVVLLTGNDDYSSMAHSWKLGADLYLTKPFRPSELANVIDCVLHV